MTSRRYLGVHDLTERYGWSEWTVYDKARRNQIPVRKHPGASGLLFLEADLDVFDDGTTELEITKLPRGGKVVKPRIARAA